MLNEINIPKDLKKLPTSKLPELAQEIRDFLLNHVSKTGGHLAPSLGVVELTIAVHYVFNSPKDKIVWDVGHQAYAHKILTGRKDNFDDLRKLNGLSGFPKRSESIHDQFDVGHASTSISAALGITKARDLQNLDFSVIAIIGDGSLTGGLALEGLNQAGYLQPEMLVILNDNKMSISANVGALSCQSKRIKNTEVYQQVKKSYYEIYNGVRQELKPKLELIKQQMKNLTTPGLLFEKLGMNYTGPINGHNIELLIKTLEKLKSKKGPQLLHIITKKGKGYIHAEENATKFHGISKFDIENGAKIGSSGLTYTKAFSNALIRIAENNGKIVAITAAMAAGTGLDKFQDNYPERFFDVGIAEEHAVTFAAGLAVQGIKPVVAIYSTFLQRSYDQLIHDVCLQNLPVVFALDRGGLVGSDGPTHHGCFDLSYLRHMPNMTVMAPKDENE
ncbi:MAG: 1-deoxy-D-xylulose-5-phosphate synthase, partial [Nanoarchaeota archaeon]|nr:1-deoxy-D-xylulose-5-phosphate synthase [Nanoarchaeota archaeon]